MDEDAEFRIEQFVLTPETLKEILEVIRLAYIDNSPEQGGTIAFDAEVFNMMFGSPYMPKDYFVRAIHKPTGKMVGFIGGLPRDLYCAGKVYRTGVPGMLAVLPEFRRHHLAFRMSLEMVQLGVRLDYDGGFALYEPEEHGIDTGKAVSKATGLEFHEIFEIRRFLIRIFNVSAVSKVIKLKWFERWGLRLLQSIPAPSTNRIRLYTSADGDQIFPLFEDYKTKNNGAFIRDKADVLWYLSQPNVLCVVHEDVHHKIDGFLVAWKFILAGFGKDVPFGWMDLVHFYRLNNNEAKELANYFAHAAKARGWVGMQMPCIPYYDSKPFRAAKYVFFPKKLLFVLFPRKPIPLPTKISTFFFDWR
jgi:hypothetical protein